ncbi:MAG: hypothetical protein Q9192_000211 [Flavoplaca navasiana]
MFQALNVVGMGFVGTEVANGLGRKRYYLEPASYKKFLKYDYLDWVQVKSMDVSWAGVPNALARVFEINLGIIAACMPIMKPFVRYVKARATGQDPHDILYRTQTPRTPSMSQNAWYSRFRFGSRKFGSSSDQSGPWRNEPYIPTKEPTSKELGTQQSLALPLEGPKVERLEDAGLAPVVHKESDRSMHSQLGPTFFIEDRV